MRTTCHLLTSIAVFLVPAAAAQEAAERFIVDEGAAPISAIVVYAPVGPDSAVVVDNTDALFLLVADRSDRTIGKRGEGPCAHMEVTSYAIAGDTVFVLDRSLGRITGYSLRSGECLMEVSHPELSGFRSLGREGSSFYLARTQVTTMTPEDEELLFEMRPSGTLLPLGLTTSDLEADLLPMPVQVGRTIYSMKSLDGVLYFLVSLSHRIWTYDTGTQEISFIELTHDSPRSGPVQDLDKAMALVPEIELEFGFFLLSNRIAVISRRKSEQKLSLYTYAGDLAARGPAGDMPSFTDGRVLYSLVATEFETKPYEIREVTLPEAR